MHAFRSYDFQDNVCQKLWTSFQAALSYRRKPRCNISETHCIYGHKFQYYSISFFNIKPLLGINTQNSFPIAVFQPVLSSSFVYNTLPKFAWISQLQVVSQYVQQISWSCIHNAVQYLCNICDTFTFLFNFFSFSARRGWGTSAIWLYTLQFVGVTEMKMWRLAHNAYIVCHITTNMKHRRHDINLAQQHLNYGSFSTTTSMNV